jgi:hypothetical protein
MRELTRQSVAWPTNQIKHRSARPVFLRHVSPNLATAEYHWPSGMTLENQAARRAVPEFRRTMFEPSTKIAEVEPNHRTALSEHAMKNYKYNWT